MPRSPARELSDRYDQNRAYFQNRDPFWRGKMILSGIALGFVVLWAAADVARPKLTRYGHTHGRLAGVHAAYDDNCAACHKEYSPSDFSLGNLFSARERWHELTCDKCHSGPVHNYKLNDDGVKHHDKCSNCHHDHEGRLNSLVRLNDADCTKCHADLNKYTTPQKPDYAQKVTNFVTDHPDFQSLDISKKPRTLVFSHALHMLPGLFYEPPEPESKEEHPFTYGRLKKLAGDDPAGAVIAARYTPEGADPKAPVQLTCASCHKLDSGAGDDDFKKLKGQLDQFGQPAKALQPLRGDGAYFQPINFEAHCRACHPLRAPAVRSGDERVFDGFNVAHRAQPKQLDEMLRGGYLSKLLENKAKPVPKSDDPGGNLTAQPDRALANPQALEADLTRFTTRARDFLLRPAAVKGKKEDPPKPDLPISSEGCFKCHKGDANAITPVIDRTVWFEHAKFNHASHRGASCATCHPGTEGRKISRTDADKPEPVLIKGAATKDTKNLCATCHSPSGTNVTLDDGTKVAGGGVRHACTDCHRYHHGYLPLQGRGSATYDPRDKDTGKLKENSLLDWLKGVPLTKDKN
jgi:Cytochrome c7 and related cytochrome c